MKILITGGHMSPAISVIENLKNDEVIYVGRKYAHEGDKAISFEYQEISKLGISFLEINTGRLQRKFTRYTFFSLMKLPLGFYRAYKILQKTKPDVILTFGSYISVPVGIMGKILNIPLIIHEQTLEAGFANRVLSFFADRVCISWESSGKYFPKTKTEITGNPIREEVLNQKETRPEKNLLYITGGSSGSHAINLLVEYTIEKLLQKFNVVHQTGDSHKFKDYDRLLEKKEKILGKNYTVYKFLNSQESAKMLSKATLVVGRSGINTVSELIFLNKPALLIPLPFSQRQEQSKNAQFIKKLGLAEEISEETLSPKDFVDTVFKMYTNIGKYKLEKKLFFDNPSKKIINILKDVSKEKTV